MLFSVIWVNFPSNLPKPLTLLSPEDNSLCFSVEWVAGVLSPPRFSCHPNFAWCKKRFCEGEK